jgi:hypothetical protein
MPIDLKLEDYLAKLDKALGPIPVSDRADIITEIKSHVLSARERGQELDTILSSLGEPETVANRYILERGLKPGRPSKTPMVKWLTIGFLGTITVCAGFLLILIFKFTPLIKVDEEQGRVILLGGLIDVSDKNSNFNIKIDGDANVAFEGERDTKKISSIRIPFSNGKFELSPANDGKLHWRCKVVGKKGEPLVTEDKRELSLNLEQAMGAKCEIELPAGIPVVMSGANGKLSILRPHADLDVKLNNGKVSLQPDPALRYKFDTSVMNGRAESFESSSDKKAIAVKIAVMNGSISRD